MIKKIKIQCDPFKPFLWKKCAKVATFGGLKKIKIKIVIFRY